MVILTIHVHRVIFMITLSMSIVKRIIVDIVVQCPSHESHDYMQCTGMAQGPQLLLLLPTPNSLPTFQCDFGLLLATTLLLPSLPPPFPSSISISIKFSMQNAGSTASGSPSAKQNGKIVKAQLHEFHEYPLGTSHQAKLHLQFQEQELRAHQLATGLPWTKMFTKRPIAKLIKRKTLQAKRFKI